MISTETTTVSTRPEAELDSRRFWTTAVALAIAAAIAEIQALMVIPMLGQLTEALNVSPSAVSWVLTATLIAGAVAVGPLTRLGDRIGPKKVYMWSMAGVLVGNLLCALAVSMSSASMMFAGRAFIGLNVGTAMGVAILRHVCSERQMAQAMGIITLGLGVGVAPSFLIAGGLQKAGVSLEGVFWTATAMTLVVVFLLLPLPSADSAQGARIPLRSSLILGAWVLPACLALTFGNQWGWFSARTVGLLVFSVVVLALWLANEQRARTPLTAPYMLRGNALIAYFCTGCVGVLAYGYYITASSFVSMPPEIAGYGFGTDTFGAGLALVPAAVVILFCGPIAGRIIHTWGPKKVLILGGTLLALLFLCMAFVRSDLWHFYAYAAWFGVGVSFFMPAGWAVFALEAKPEDIGIAGGMSQISGMILGGLAASMGVVFTTREFIPGTPMSVPSGYTHMFLFMAVVLGAATLLALRIKPRQQEAPAPPPAVDLVAAPVVG